MPNFHLLVLPAKVRGASLSRLLRLAAAPLLFATTCAFAAPPATAKKPVSDEYHGVSVVDDYRWLENWDDAAVKVWSESQNEHARAYLDKIDFVPALRERVTELEDAVGARYLEVKFAGGVYFAAKTLPGKQQPVIVARKALTEGAEERVVLDLNELDKTGGTAYDFFTPSPNGKLLAFSLSSGGSESGDARVFDADTGAERAADLVPRVNGGTAGGAIAWAADSAGFYYTRYPRTGERPDADMNSFTQVYFHKLGTPTAQDKYETGKEYPRIAEIQIEVSPTGEWVLTNVQNGDGGEFIQELRGPSGTWTKLTNWADRVVEAKFGHDSAAYLVSRKNAPMGKVLRLALAAGKEPTLAEAVEIVPPQADASIQTEFSERSGITLTQSRLFILYQVGGPNELRSFELANGKARAHGTVKSLPISSIDHVETLPGDGIVYQNSCYIAPPAWYMLRTDAAADSAGIVEPTALRQAAPPNMPELVVHREMATSKDGTKVPLNIIMRKDVRERIDAERVAKNKTADGAAEITGTLRNIPTLVWGYGGYGVNESPVFSRRVVLFCEQGGIYVMANIRGGGEFGEQWHLAGNLTRKQNCFDDFQAAARHMIDSGYTSHDKLGIIGGSNGGLLMGATFTQRPELCKCVVSMVGIYDMLRVELSPNGAFNVTEFGTVKDKAQFDALFAYSPYHHVKTGVKYPAILFTTGANDPRVDPMQSRKMTAALQAAQADIPADKGGPSPVYLRTSGNTGHGMGSPLSARIEETTDVFAFVFDQLGMKFARPGAK